MFAVHETPDPIGGTSAQVLVGQGHDWAHSVAESYLLDL
jgi:hypothetical protein